MAAKDMFLYWGSGSVPCWKPMIVLEEKCLQGYGQTLVSFTKKEHKGEDILKLNPRGQVPTFKDGDTVVNESGAICDYLEFKFSGQGHHLLPVDMALRGRVLQRVYEAQNLNKALLEGVVFYQMRTKPEDRDEEVLNSKKKEATNELKIWEGYLEKEGSDGHVVGRDFTMADVYVFPILAFAVRSKLNMDSYPFLKAYYEKVVQRPSIKATWPPHWKDSEGTDLFKGV